MAERTVRPRWWVFASAVAAGLTIAVVGSLVFLVVVPWVQDERWPPTCDDPRGLVPLEQVMVSADAANSSLPGYEPQRMLDTDASTAWVEGVSGADPSTNLGQGFTLEFDLPDGVDLQMICVVNGSASSWQSSRAMASIRLLTVSTDAGENVVSALRARREADFAAFESLDFAHGSTDRVTMRVDSARAGADGGQASSSTDLAVSEFEFWVRP